MECCSETYRELRQTAAQCLCCICCALILGPLLLLIALIVLLIAIANPRGKITKPYNKAVDVWVASGRANFQRATFTNNNSPSGTTPALSADTNVDLIVGTQSDLHKYTPLKYVMTGYNFPATNNASAANDVTATMRVDVSGTTTPTTLTYAFALKQSGTKVLDRCNANARSTPTPRTVLPLAEPGYSLGVEARATRRGPPSPPPPPPPPCSSKCTSLGGVYDFGARVCRVTYASTAVCIKVAPSGTAWAMASTPGNDIGCLRQKSGTYATGPWDPETVNTAVSSSVVNPVNLGLTVRSNQDPYVLLSDLTNGTFNPGLTRGQLLTIAIVLFVLGGLGTCCIYGGIYLVFFQRSRASRPAQPQQNNSLSNAAVPVAQPVAQPAPAPVPAPAPAPAPAPYAAQPAPAPAPAPYNPEPAPYAAQPAPYAAQPAPYAAQPSPYAAQPSPYAAQPSPYAAQPPPAASPYGSPYGGPPSANPYGGPPSGNPYGAPAPAYGGGQPPSNPYAAAPPPAY